MRIPTRILPIAMILLAFGCGNTNDTTEQDMSIAKQVIPNLIYGPNEQCKAYWLRVDSLNEIKHDFFRENILQPALQNKDLPKANREFLLQLDQYLHLSFLEKSSRFTIDQVLLPIFNLDTNELGIIGALKSNFNSKNEMTILNPEMELLPADIFNNTHIPKLTHFKSSYDSLFSERNAQIYVFTDKRRVNTTITNFGIYVDMCLEYVHYPIATEVFDPAEKVLFGSYLPLELNYERHPQIDAIMKNAYVDGCYDCRLKYEPANVFATLKGIESLYFTYTDTFPINDQYDYPARELVLKIDDHTVISLWTESVDLFGCGCL